MDNNVDARAARIAAKEAKQAEKLAKKAAAIAAKEAARAAEIAENKKRQAADAAQYEKQKAADAAEKKALNEKIGKLAASVTIQNESWPYITTVKVFDKGYVMVKGKYEKLRGISGDVQVSKKTGIGRGLAAVATAGLNLAVSNSQRGRIHVTIVTDVQTHTFSTDQVSDSAIRDYQTLLGTGTAILEMLSTQNQTAASATKPESDVTEKIRQLSEFFEQGILSEKEFAAAKAKLLGTN